MKLKTVVLVMALSLLSPVANADEQSHRAAAEELLLLTNVDKMLKPMLEQMGAMMEQQFRLLDAPEELRPVLDRYLGKMIKLMEEELGWNELKDDYIDIYVKTYSEPEIKAISEFYKSPAGRKYVEKMPQLMQESMAVSQKKMPMFMENAQKISAEMAYEIKQLKEEKK